MAGRRPGARALCSGRPWPELAAGADLPRRARRAVRLRLRLGSFAYTRIVFKLSPTAHLRAVAPAYAVDTLLAPLGLLVAYPAYRHPLALLLLLPRPRRLSTFARERRYRIDNAVELSNAYRGTAMLLGDVIEADDEYTGSHSRDVVDLVLAVADQLGLDPAERQQAEFAALLHDVGKVKVPAEIINKPGPLDDAEWAS